MKRLTFIPQLDSFRFFAVLLVMFCHWLPQYDSLPWGALGVTFFFVLSGYLISGNLLYLKQSIDKGELSRSSAFKLFYLRRTLRIFPLYYLAIILLYILAKQAFTGDVLWYVTYTPNFVMFRAKTWPGMLSHFWSLGVEEQFYLLWPLLIFLVRWNRLKYLFVSFIAFSVIYKAIVYFSHGSAWHTVLPWSNFDAFGIGALLAYLPFAERDFPFLKRIAFTAGFIVFTALALFCDRQGLFFLFGLFISLASALIIRKTQKGFTGITGSILNLPAIQYLGRISYGLYVYHQFTPWLWRCLTGREDLYPLPITLFRGAWTARPLVALGAQFALLVLIATLSWYLVEKPFINLKHRVEPKPRPALTA